MQKTFLLSFIAAIALAEPQAAEPTNSALADESTLQNERERERE